MTFALCNNSLCTLGNPCNPSYCSLRCSAGPLLQSLMAYWHTPCSQINFFSISPLFTYPLTCFAISPSFSHFPCRVCNFPPLFHISPLSLAIVSPQFTFCLH